MDLSTHLQNAQQFALDGISTSVITAHTERYRVILAELTQALVAFELMRKELDGLRAYKSSVDEALIGGPLRP